MGQAGDPTAEPRFQHGTPRAKTKTHWEWTHRVWNFVSKGFVTPVTFGSGTELSQTHGIPEWWGGVTRDLFFFMRSAFIHP